MTVALVMIAKDEAGSIGQAIATALPLIDTFTILDTGSSDGTREEALATLDGMPGTYEDGEFRGSAGSRQDALWIARGTADWLLMMDADMTVEHLPGFRRWLDDAPPDRRDRDVTAWQIEIHDRNLRFRMPWLMRGDLEWRYEGVTHPCLVANGKQRPVSGITLHHHGVYSAEKIEDDLEALAAGVAEGDPRSIYYTGWTLMNLRRTEEAAGMFGRRAGMGGFEEEAWHAEYMAAKLRQDVPGLLTAWRRRPHRHEPLTEASRLVKEQGLSLDPPDVLFLED